MKAIIDRFEGEHAIVLFEKKEIKVDIPKKILPTGVKEGTCLNIDFSIDNETTKNRKKKIGNLLDKLKNK